MRKLSMLFLGLTLLIGSQAIRADGGTKPSPSSSKPSPPPMRTFSSGTKPTPKPHVDPPKKYGSGTPKPEHSGGKYGSGKDHAPSTAGTKPKSTYDPKAAEAARKQESKQKFEKGTAPAPAYTDAKGKTHTIDPKDRKISQLRSQLNHEKWQNRDLRERNFYQSYYSRPIVVYHDPYNSFFWYWMLDRSIEQQAMWAYNHRASMDAARYNDLLSKNAELAGRVRALESQNVPRNPAYQPAGMQEADLMYTKDYVNAAYNPEPVQQVHTWRGAGGPDGGSVIKVLLIIFLSLGIISLLVWLVFVKKW